MGFVFLRAMVYLCIMKRKDTKGARRGRAAKGARLPLWKNWRFVAPAVALLVILIGVAVWYHRECTVEYTGNEDVRIYIPRGSTEQAISDTLRRALGDEYATQVLKLRGWHNGTTANAAGSYVITPGMTANTASRKLVAGLQDPVKVTFNNARTMQQLAEKVSRNMEFDADDFIAACDTVLSGMGFAPEYYPAAFLPDTYEFYWSSSAAQVVKRLASIRNNWWNQKRRDRAKELGLTPEQVATLASIVEEETAKADEKPKVARLYLNRLDRGMRLQADPTVKFSVGDFTLRRITNEHLKTESPYNTYLHDGLPPGPIRVVEAKTMEAVLDAPQHEYLYMCAKEDFSGYHNFAVTNAEHEANARRYHEELNRRNIH